MTRSKDPNNDDDKALWEAYTKDITASEEVLPEDEDFTQMLEESADLSDLPEDQRDEEGPKNERAAPSRLKQEHHAPQLDKRTEERLRKGKMPIEARLDLHGYNQAQAHEALDKFIQDAAHAGKRCVLVVTGKGKATATSEDWLSPAEGILKQRVPEWLSARTLRSHILKFYPAQPQHGGSGALYVYLKRQR